MKKIGKISYSAYLWHWPILGIFYSLDTTVYTNFIAVAMTFLISFFSFKFIESPFRNSLSIKGVMLSLGALLVTLSLVIVLMINQSKPEDLISVLQPERPYLQESECFLGQKETYNLRECFKNYDQDQFNIVIIGDSHAASIFPGLKNMSTEDSSVYQLTYTSCIPILSQNEIYNLIETNFVQQSNSDECQLTKKLISRQLSSLQPEMVVISANHAAWSTNFHEFSKGPQEMNFDNYFTSLETALSNLKDDLPSSHIVLTGQLPLWRPGIPTIFNARYVLTFFGYEFDATDFAAHEVFKIDQRLGAIAERLKITIIKPLNLFCNSKRCSGLTRNGAAVSHDYGHLSLAGSNDFAEYFYDVLFHLERNDFSN